MISWLLSYKSIRKDVISLLLILLVIYYLSKYQNYTSFTLTQKNQKTTFIMSQKIPTTLSPIIFPTCFNK